MKILIALASSSAQLSGVQRHAINLAGCLLTRGEVSEVHLVVATWQVEMVSEGLSQDEHSGRLHVHAAPVGNSAISRNRWLYLHLPKLASHLGVGLVHLAYPMPVNKRAYSCPVVVTLHDLYPYDIPENFGRPKVLFNQLVLKRCLRSVDAIACVSHFTQSRLRSIVPRLAPDKSQVIFNSVQASTVDQAGAPEWGALPFLLCVAQHRRNKNILLALTVFNQLLRSKAIAENTRMLVVGIPGPETPALRAFIAEAGLEDKVSLLNGISDADLQWSYRNCLLLLAPSRLEGFGLPVAEALLSGCRVVCSDIPAFRELGSDHCRYVPLGVNEIEMFVDAVQSEIHSPRPQPVPMPQLSATVIAEEYLRFYRPLLEAKSRREVAVRPPLNATTGQQPLS